jgi:hypothetical protein
MSLENGVPSFDDRDEGVLNDVLEELDRERLHRAELAATVRKLQDAVSAQEEKARSSISTPGEMISERAFLAMETQVQGYQQLVDALTLGKPAIAAAATAEAVRKPKSGAMPQRKTLPLHVVRLLEVLPWDPKAQQYIFAVEEVFEWQIFHESAWHGHLRSFPAAFKSLPVVQAGGEDRIIEDGRHLLNFLAGATEVGRTQGRTYTDWRLTARYDLDAGYPLPADGGVWEWVGSWRVHSGARVTGSMTEAMDHHEQVDCDAHGWSYVLEPRDFLLGLKDMIWDHAGTKTTGGAIPLRPFRRRRWTRQRVLVDYLSASECTKQYLKLLAENARLSMSAAKINEQLIATKTALTETEEKLLHANDLLQRKTADGGERMDPCSTARDAVMSSVNTTLPDSPRAELTTTKSFPNDATVRLDAVVEPPTSPSSKDDFKFDWTKIGIVNKLAKGNNPSSSAAGGGSGQPPPSLAKTPNIFRMISPDFPNSESRNVN